MSSTGTSNSTVIDEIIGLFASSAVDIVAKREKAAQTAGHSLEVFALIAPSTVRLACGIVVDSYEKIKSYISGEGRPITQEEFLEALNYHGLIEKLRQSLKEYALRSNITELDLYSKVLDRICKNPAYRNIDEEYKIELARRLTDGLL